MVNQKYRGKMVSLSKLIDGVLAADPMDLIVWLQWYVSKGNITCKHCIETMKMQGGTPPNCYKCGLPTAKLLRRHFGEREDD